MTPYQLNLKLDASPLLSYLDILKCVQNSPLSGIKLSSDLIRIQCDTLATTTNELTIRFYPSESFLVRVAAFWTRYINHMVVEKS